MWTSCRWSLHSARSVQVFVKHMQMLLATPGVQCCNGTAHLQSTGLAPGKHLVAGARAHAASAAPALHGTGRRHPALLQPGYAAL